MKVAHKVVPRFFSGVQGRQFFVKGSCNVGGEWLSGPLADAVREGVWI